MNRALPSIAASLAALALAASPPLRGQDRSQVLPQSYSLSRYSVLWEHSPFQREVAKVVAETVQSAFAQTLVLEGLVDDEASGPIAYVRDQRENLFYVITTAESDDHPYLIESASQARDPRQSKVVITDGNERREIGYPSDALSRAIEQVLAAPTPEAERSDPSAPRPAAEGAPEAPAKAGGDPSDGSSPQAVPPGAAPPQNEVDPAAKGPARRRVIIPGRFSDPPPGALPGGSSDPPPASADNEAPTER